MVLDLITRPTAQYDKDDKTFLVALNCSSEGCQSGKRQRSKSFEAHYLKSKNDSCSIKDTYIRVIKLYLCVGRDHIENVLGIPR